MSESRNSSNAPHPVRATVDKVLYRHNASRVHIPRTTVGGSADSFCGAPTEQLNLKPTEAIPPAFAPLCTECAEHYQLYTTADEQLPPTARLRLTQLDPHGDDRSSTKLPGVARKWLGDPSAVGVWHGDGRIHVRPWQALPSTVTAAQPTTTEVPPFTAIKRNAKMRTDVPSRILQALDIPPNHVIAWWPTTDQQSHIIGRHLDSLSRR